MGQYREFNNIAHSVLCHNIASIPTKFDQSDFSCKSLTSDYDDKDSCNKIQASLRTTPAKKLECYFETIKDPAAHVSHILINPKIL